MKTEHDGPFSISNNSDIFLSTQFFHFSQGFPRQFYPMGRIDQPVQDGICKGRLPIRSCHPATGICEVMITEHFSYRLSTISINSCLLGASIGVAAKSSSINKGTLANIRFQRRYVPSSLLSFARSKKSLVEKKSVL